MDLSEALLFDDNLFQRSSGAEEVYAAITKGDLKLSRVTRQTALSLGIGADIEEYWGPLKDESSIDLDSVSPRADLQVVRTLKNAALEFSTAYRRQPTRTSELDDSGRLIDDAERQTISLRAGWSFTPSRRNGFALSGNFSDVAFEGTTSLNEYRSFGGGLNWIHQVNPRHRLIAGFAGQQFESQGDDGEDTRILSGTIGLESEITPSLSTRIYGGIADVSGNDIDSIILGAPSEEDSLRSIFGGRIRYQATERLRLSANADLEVAPSSTGLSQETQRAGILVQFDLTRLVGFEFSARYFRREDLFGLLEGSREFYEISPELNWRLTPAVSIFAGYRYRGDERDLPAETAESNSFRFGLKAAWPGDERMGRAR